jgi:hypothetical protein
VREKGRWAGVNFENPTPMPAMPLQLSEGGHATRYWKTHTMRIQSRMYDVTSSLEMRAMAGFTWSVDMLAVLSLSPILRMSMSLLFKDHDVKKLIFL